MFQRRKLRLREEAAQVLVSSWEQDSNSCDLVPAKRKGFMAKTEP